MLQLHMLHKVITSQCSNRWLPEGRVGRGSHRALQPQNAGFLLHQPSSPRVLCAYLTISYLAGIAFAMPGGYPEWSALILEVSHAPENWHRNRH